MIPLPRKTLLLASLGGLLCCSNLQAQSQNRISIDAKYFSLSLIETAIQDAPQPDVQFAIGNALSVNWELRYTAAVLDKGVSRRLFGSRKSDGNEHFFRGTSAETFGESQISPDGKIWLFCGGDLEWQYGAYQIALWDLAASEVDVLPFSLYYPEIRWSPDSRYLAFYEGADKLGEPTLLGKRPFLGTYDTQTKKRGPALEQTGITTWAWTPSGSILYTANYQAFQKPVVQNIKEFDLAKQTTKTLIPNASYPTPSPNGKWILYLRHLQGQKYNIELFNRELKQSKSVHLPLQMTGELEIVWSANSREIFLISTDGKLKQIQKIDVFAPQLTSPRLLDDEPDWTTLCKLPFTRQAQGNHTILKTTSDGHYLILDNRRPDDYNTKRMLDELLAVDTSSGQIHLLASHLAATNAMSWDWSEQK